jgi:hypothetical protein
MVKELKYNITGQQVIIYPLHFLKVIGIAVIIFMFLMCLTIALIFVSTTESASVYQSIIISAAGAFIFALFCIPLFTYSRRQVIFDSNEKMVYKKTIFGKKQLMTFADAGDIAFTNFRGLYYGLLNKQDKYGARVAISPRFANETSKTKLEFDQVVLPAIKKMLSTSVTVSPADNSRELFDAGMLKYFAPEENGYTFKPVNNNWQALPLVLIGIAGLIYCGYMYNTLRPNNTGYYFITALALLFFLSGVKLLGSKFYFDKTNREIIVRSFGLTLKSFRMQDFEKFNIVRRYHNGTYAGTDVRMEFTRPGSKAKRNLHIGQFKKTNPVEDFIKETEYVMGIKQGN